MKKKYHPVHNQYAINILRDKANEYHSQARSAWGDFLEHARKSGACLNKLRPYFRRTWKKWVRKNFNGSYETVKVYCRIAREWEDPRLLEARRKGVELKSINGVLNILRNKPLKPQQPPEDKIKVEMCRQELYKLITQEIKKMPFDVMEVFFNNFENVWDGFFIRFKKYVHKELNYDPDKKLLEQNPPEPKKPFKKMSRWEIERLANKDQYCPINLRHF